MKRLMVDVETFSTHPNAAIRSIGAVLVDDTTTITTHFYAALDTTILPVPQFHFSDATIDWWHAQSAEAKEQFKYPQPPLDVMAQFVTFAVGCDEVWANGAQFDIPIIENALYVFKLPTPWEYSAVRDFRTVRKLFPGTHWEPYKHSVKHNAHHDALNQMIELQAILRRIGKMADG